MSHGHFVYVYRDISPIPDRQMPRVRQGLLVHLGPWNLRDATILYRGAGTSLEIHRFAHLTQRTSAECWVYASEFEQLAEVIERDWVHRQLWHEAYEDVQKFRAIRTRLL